MKKIALFISIIIVTQSCTSRLIDNESRTFTNPLFNSGADPWVTYNNGYYYYSGSGGGGLYIRKGKNLDDLKASESITVWTPPRGTSWSRELWAPELHNINDDWYMYFAADDGKNMNHRMYVLENRAEDPTTGTWEFKGKIADPSDKWAIDGSVFEYSGKLYMAWSGWEGDVNGSQNIYLARMSNPWTFDSPRVKISTPELSWETIGDLNNPNDVPHVNVNEGPVSLQNKGKLFIVYSASGCWTDSYCLGLLTYDGKGDILDPASWKKNPEPVFRGKPESSAYSPGHNCFFKSPDGNEYWILYHANPSPGQGCGRYRSPRAQPFTFSNDGMPQFGEPAATGSPMKVPSEGRKK
ncbi:MAG TPA: glycoside hydrolase family 43 protein [Bacteroidales bacterium]|jgi:GH43 family beta-xylosidase|nr:glycoside hydrolase family 43 protein [Bacteroidales bacterium]